MTWSPELFLGLGTQSYFPIGLPGSVCHLCEINHLPLSSQFHGLSFVGDYNFTCRPKPKNLHFWLTSKIWNLLIKWNAVYIRLSLVQFLICYVPCPALSLVYKELISITVKRDRYRYRRDFILIQFRESLTTWVEKNLRGHPGFTYILSYIWQKWNWGKVNFYQALEQTSRVLSAGIYFFCFDGLWTWPCWL